MRIKRLTIDNIASIGHADINFDAMPLSGERLFLITGKTGSGKSTIIDCLCLALYGDTPRLCDADNAAYDNIRSDGTIVGTINTKTAKQLLRRGAVSAQVCLTFDDNNGVPYIATWSVHRARGKADGNIQEIERTLSTEDGVTPAYYSCKTTDITKHVTEIIGLTMKEFFRTVVLAQGKFSEFLNSKENDKADLLEKMTGTEIYTQIGTKIYRTCQEKENERNYLLEQLRGIHLMNEDEKTQIKEGIATHDKERNALSEQIKGAQQMAQWIEDKTRNEQNLGDRRKSLEEKQAKAQEAEFVEQQRLVNDWDATVEPRLQLKDSREAERQIQSLMGRKSALQEEFDRLCAALRAAVSTLETQRQQLGDIDEYLQREALNSEMYKGIKGIKSLLDQRRIAQDNIATFTASLQQERERLPKVEQTATTAATALQQQAQTVKQLEEQYEAMNVTDIHNRKETIANAKNAITLFKSANDNVDQATAQVNELNNNLEDVQKALKKAQDTLGDKRTIKQQAEEAVEREHDINSLVQQAHQSLHQGDICPVCGNIITRLSEPHGEQLIESLRARLREAEKELRDTETQIAASNKNIGQLMPQIERARKEQAEKAAARDHQRQTAMQWLQRCGQTASPMADNDQADALITALDRETERLNEVLIQADALNKRIAEERHRLNEQTDANNNAKNDLNKVIESIKYQQEAINVSTKQVSSLITNLNELFSFRDWQERMAGDPDFIGGLERQAAHFQAQESAAVQLRKAISKTEPLLPAMQAIKRGITSLEDHGYTIDTAPANLDGQWRQFKDEFSDWSNLIQNERARAERASQALARYMGEHTDITIERLTQLNSHSQTEIEDIRQRQKDLMDSITRMQGEISTLVQQQGELKGRKPVFPEEDRDRLAEIIQTGQTKQQEYADAIAALSIKLSEDETNQKLAGEKKKALDQAEAIYCKWADFSRILGSADGKTFRNIAQSYILGQLLNSANGYLRQFNIRYELEPKPGSLVILVRDLQQGDLTSVNTLSGGESFMVSLALALALSGTTGKMFSVDTLFIDEGFGSLSHEYLTSVMETLHRLYEIGGKRVGIISHVEMLKERVTTQIQVTRDLKNNTVSHITVVPESEIS